MRFIYQEWDGSPFPDQQHLAQFERFLDLVMDHGAPAMDALEDLSLDDEQRAMIERWVEEGLLEKAGSRFRLTPRAVNSLSRKALMEVFSGMKPNASEGHDTPADGRGGSRSEGSRPYEFGDAVSGLDLTQTLRNAIVRGGPGVPVSLEERDFEVVQTEAKSTCSTVILLDMSGSMSRWHRFASAKRCAMAVHALIRQRFPLDSVDVVGFYSGAETIAEHRLALSMPKQVTLFDPEVRMRVDLDRLDEAPQHFTNLHMGLLSARRILARRGGQNKQVFIITDGEPTAYVEGGAVHLVYPPDERTSVVTLTEALLMAKQGIRFSTFALIEDYTYMDWLGFVDRLTRLTRGVAFYGTSDDLGSAIMESYLSGRRRRTHLT